VRYCSGSILVAVVLGVILSAGVPAVHAENIPVEKVEKAIQKGIKHLWDTQLPNGSWKGHGKQYPVGPTAIAAYALLESGIKPTNAKMKKAMKYLLKTKTNKTYGLGLRANAYHAANKYSRKKPYMKALKADVKLLVNSTMIGSYNYDCKGDRQSKGDHSNSQYGVYGVWAGSMETQIEIPIKYWKMVYKYWVSQQVKDGGWDYHGKKRSTLTMTSAGLATLYVCLDKMNAREYIKCKGDADKKPIKAALAWAEKNYPGQYGKTGHGGIGYHLYGVERVGLASGYKYFGKSDWYKEGVKVCLEKQNKNNGGWGEAHNTAYALLFLLRGRNPIAFNKLEYDGHWNNRPRDLANLTRHTSKEFERTINWQTINLSIPMTDMHDAPILYIAGSKAPKFTPEQMKKLRTFVYEGGTILSVSECGRAFDTGMRKVYKELFPRYELVKCGKDHPLYTAYKDLKGSPKMNVMTNGVRPLVIHTDQDLAKSWIMRSSSTSRKHFDIASNILFYVVGGLSDLGPRGVSYYPFPADKLPVNRKLRVARLSIVGNNDPEPLAFDSLARKLRRQEKLDLEFVPTDASLISEPVKKGEALAPGLVRPIEVAEGKVQQGLIKPTALATSDAKVAFLSGTGKFKLSEADLAAIKAWVQGGGTLIVNSVGGNAAFAKSAKGYIQDMFGEELYSVSVAAKVFTGKGHEVGKLRYRRASQKRLGAQRGPLLEGVTINGRLAVYFSREDLVAGMMGFPSGTVDGYRPKEAYNIVRNILVDVAPVDPEAAARDAAAARKAAEAEDE
jgi:hypothetical protein